MSCNQNRLLLLLLRLKAHARPQVDYNPLLKGSTCAAPETTRLLLSFFIFSRARLDKKIEYCCRVCAEAARDLFYRIERVQNRERGLGYKIGYFSPYRSTPLTNGRLLLYRYFHDKCSDELHTLLSPARARHAKFTKSSDPHLPIPFVRMSSAQRAFLLPRTTTL